MPKLKVVLESYRESFSHRGAVPSVVAVVYVHNPSDPAIPIVLRCEEPSDWWRERLGKTIMLVAEDT